MTKWLYIRPQQAVGRPSSSALVYVVMAAHA